VASKYIFSAAHCFLNTDDKSIINYIFKPNDISVKLGYLPPTKALTINLVEQIIFHPGYVTQIGQKRKLDNDFAILKLKVKIDLKKFFPVCLPSSLQKSGTCEKYWRNLCCQT